MTLQELLKVLHDHLLFVILLPLMSALVIGFVSFVLPNQYTASTTVYVLAKSSNTSTSSTSSDLTASQMITNDIATLIQSSNVSSSTASQLGLENLNGYSIKTTSSTTTRILTISVTGPNAQTAANIANTIVSVTSGISQNVMDVQSVNAIETGKYDPSLPLAFRIARLFDARIEDVFSDAA